MMRVCGGDNGGGGGIAIGKCEVRERPWYGVLLQYSTKASSQ